MSLRRIIADYIYKRFPSLSALLAVCYGYIIWRPCKSYSLYGEDLVVTNVFSQAGIKTGVYVDIGAFHPRWISNSHKLAKCGWKGIVVDLDPKKLAAFKYLRKHAIVKVGAVVPKSYLSEFINIYAFNRMCSEYDTLSENEANATSLKYGLDYTIKSLPSLRIDQLLNEAATIFDAHIDYLNIDIEGMDDEVLNGIDLREFGVKCLQFENSKSFGGSNLLKCFLSKIDFTHVATNGGTHTYVSNDILRNRFECI